MLEPAFGVPARRPTVSVTAPLAAVLEAAVDSPARPVAAVVPVPALRLLFQMLQLTGISINHFDCLRTRDRRHPL